MRPSVLPTQVTDRSFNSEVLRHDTVVVAFVATGSTPCHVFTAVLEQLAGTVPVGVRVCRLDVDENPLTVRRYEVSSLPTILVFRAGALQARLVGSRSAQRLWREVSVHVL